MKELIFEATLPDCLAYPDWVEDIIQKWQEEAVSFVDQRIQSQGVSLEMIHEIFDSSLPLRHYYNRSSGSF